MCQFLQYFNALKNKLNLNFTLMKMMLKSFLFFATLLCFGMTEAQTVSGTVSDNQGPLPGATVVVKGTATGTTADFDGNYSISASAGDVLVFSYVGYSAQEITVGNQSTIACST